MCFERCSLLVLEMDMRQGRFVFVRRFARGSTDSQASGRADRIAADILVNELKAE